MATMTSPARRVESEGYRALRVTWALTKPYFASRKSALSWFLMVAVAVLNVFEVWCDVRLSEWNKAFFNAIQDLDWAQFFHQLLVFPVVVVGLMGGFTLESYCAQILQLRWREWLTAKCLTLWLEHQAYYRLTWAENRTDNPDQRISEDVGHFIEKSVNLSTDLFNAVLTLVSFSVILWKASGPLGFELPVLGSVQIPGYLVWAALAYAIVGTGVVHAIGRKMVDLDVTQERFEANFRYALVRVRENAGSIAFYGGEGSEREVLDGRFRSLLANWRRLIVRTVAVRGATIIYSNVSTVIPWLLLASRYFAKAMKMGDVTQAASAFGHVRATLSVFINNYASLASWRATVRRLAGFAEALSEINSAAQQSETEAESLYLFRQALLGAGGGLAPQPGIEVEKSPDHVLRVLNVETRTNEGATLGAATSFQVSPGERVLVMGPSGCGKTSLLRAVAGLWPHGRGRVECPAGSRLFLAQRPYLPLGTLRRAVCYPRADSAVPPAEVESVLRAVGLDRLAPRLDDEADWSQMLSLGEQQRVAFARALLVAPHLLVLDEATSAVDEEGEAELYGLIAKRLATSIVVSVGHRRTLEAFHHRTVRLHRAVSEPSGAVA